MRNTTSVLLSLVAAILLSAGQVGAVPADTAVLARSYLRYMLTDQVKQQAALIGQDALDDDKPQVDKAATAWASTQMKDIRSELKNQFGPDSRARFEAFLGQYKAAERTGDQAFLQEVSGALGIAPAPQDFQGMRQAALEVVLAGDMAGASAWLGEVQTWVDVRRKNQDAPALDVWLTRSEPTPPQQAESAQIPATAPQTTEVPPAQGVVTPPKKKPAAMDLASAEVGAGEFVDEVDEEGSPLDDFDDMRSKRREKALEEAQAGMEQISAERKAAEEEYASKKLAAAQADAEALKRQAEKLASVEKEALDQRQKSWGNRLKAIVGATVSAATGAFAGGIGARAGEEAVNAIFDD